MLELIYRTILTPIVRQINSGLLAFPFQETELNEMYRYAVRGGRRSRALLILCGCKAVGGTPSEAMPAALAVELFHKASLIMDDLVDQDTMRRSRPAFHVRYGMRQTIVMGDLLVSLAYRQLDRLNQTHESDTVLACYALLSDTYYTLCQGEIQELLGSADTAMTEEEALEIAYRKSGMAIESCLRVGAMLGQGQEVEVQAMADFGQSVGLAFQLVNDLNNLCGEEELIGRQIGSDLLTKRMTFLLAYALRHANEADQARLNNLLRGTGSKPTDLTEAVQIIRRSGAILATEKKIADLLQDARESLRPLPPSVIKKMLLLITRSAHERWLWVGPEIGD